MPTAVTSPLILRAAKGEGRAMPLSLAGLPKEIEGRRVHYRRKELARVGSFVHRGTGQVVSITRQRMQQWVAAFNRRLAKGIKPFIPTKHTLDPRAEDNKGYVVGLSVEGDSLYADLQLIGDDALDLAARNDVSLCAIADALDGDGEKHAEALHHVALTPNPALSNLGGFVKIAASAGAAPADMPVYERIDPFALSAGSPARRIAMFRPDVIAKLRGHLKLGDEVPDEQVATVAVEHVAAAIDAQAKAQKDADKVVSLSADVKRLQGELQAEREKVTALSADAEPELDPRMLGMIRKTCKSAREAAIASGVISPAGMEKIDNLLGVNDPAGKGIALSLSADNPDETVYTSLCEIIAAHPGVKTNMAIKRPAVSLSASTGRDDQEVTLERKRQLLAETPLGQSALAAAK